jgi:hypothetical protein
MDYHTQYLMIVYGDALSMSLPGLIHAWYAFEDPDSNCPSPDDHDGIAFHLTSDGPAPFDVCDTVSSNKFIELLCCRFAV